MRSEEEWEAIRADYEGGLSLDAIRATWMIGRETLKRAASDGRWKRKTALRAPSTAKRPEVERAEPLLTVGDDLLAQALGRAGYARFVAPPAPPSQTSPPPWSDR